jgi:hypothetical protein
VRRRAGGEHGQHAGAAAAPGRNGRRDGHDSEHKARDDDAQRRCFVAARSEDGDEVEGAEQDAEARPVVTAGVRFMEALRGGARLR